MTSLRRDYTYQFLENLKPGIFKIGIFRVFRYLACHIELFVRRYQWKKGWEISSFVNKELFVVRVILLTVNRRNTSLSAK